MSTTHHYIEHWNHFRSPPRCWFTNLPLMAPNGGTTKLQRLQEATVEHLIPQRRNRWIFNREPIADVDNLVWAASFVNNLVGNSPLSIKMRIREHAQRVVAGNTYLSVKAVDRITAFIRDLYAGYQIGTSEIWLFNANWSSPIKALSDDDAGRNMTRLYNELFAAEKIARARLVEETNVHAILVTEKNHGALLIPDADVELGRRFKRRSDQTRYTVSVAGKLWTHRPGSKTLAPPPPAFATLGDLLRTKA